MTNVAFQTTRWSIVITARDQSSAAAREAFDGLARMYWKPLYAYVRRRGHSAEESEDLVQGFFARFIEKDYINAVSEDKGRFRAFLLTCIKRYMADEYDKATAQKRGGHARAMPLDTAGVESTIIAPVNTLASPDAAYDRAWAITVLDEALGRVGREYADRDLKTVFSILKPRIIGHDTRGYDAIAQELDTTEAAARKQVQRLRKRYKEAVRGVVRDSLRLDSDVEDELRILFDALG